MRSLYSQPPSLASAAMCLGALIVLIWSAFSSVADTPRGFAISVAMVLLGSLMGAWGTTRIVRWARKAAH